VTMQKFYQGKTLTHQIRKRSWHKVRFFTKGKVNKHVIKIEKQPFENVFFNTHTTRVFLPIQKLIKGQKYRRKFVDNKSRNLFGTTAKKGGILMQRGNVGGNLFSLIRSRIWLPISFALQNFGGLFSSLFVEIPSTAAVQDSEKI